MMGRVSLCQHGVDGFARFVQLNRDFREVEGERADGEWLHASAVKDLMKRLDPSFSEKALGFRSFSDFLKAQTEHVEVDEDSNIVQVRAVARAA